MEVKIDGDTRKIKDIYDCVAIISDEELYPLQKWYTEDLKSITKNALEKSVMHEWLYDGEKDEFKEIVNVIAKKLT